MDDERVDSPPASAPAERWTWALVPWVAGSAWIVGLAVMVRHTELLLGRYVAGGVPPVSGFALLLVLLVAQGLLRRLAHREVLTRRQILLAYLMLGFASPLIGSYLVRAWLPHLVALAYWEPKRPELAGLGQYLPHWIGPTSAAAIRNYWEGSHFAGATPWAEWRKPLLMWSVFFGAVGVAMYSLMALFQRQWIRAERLTYPLLYLPLTLTDASAGHHERQVWRQWLFWAGIGVTLLFSAANVAHCVVPSVPAPGFSKSMAPYFTVRPWTPFASLNLYYMIETIGFGYFIPLEVSFTVWFSYLAVKLFACAGIASGLERPGFPFIHEQCSGAYFACAVAVLAGSRRHLAALWRAAWRLGEAEESERVAWISLFAALAVMLWFMVLTGVPLVVAAAFWAVLLVFIVVYARIRAETGAPLEFTYPYWMPKTLVTWAFTPSGVVALGGMRAPVSFGLFSWLSRHHWAMSQAAYSADAFKIRETVGISRRVLAITVGLAIVVGVAASVWAHLDAYYEVGTNLASGSLGRGEYRATVAVDEFNRTATELAGNWRRPWERLTYAGGGFVIAGLLALLRSHVPGWPLHPLGFILATAYGDHNTAIFPMFVAWAAKAMIQKAGGLKAYRKGVPFFIGLIAGHFFWAGVVWPIIAVAIGPERSGGYHIFFGG